MCFGLSAFQLYVFELYVFECSDLTGNCESSDDIGVDGTVSGSNVGIGAPSAFWWWMIANSSLVASKETRLCCSPICGKRSARRTCPPRWCCC